jgi:hypothetical protein
MGIAVRFAIQLELPGGPLLHGMWARSADDKGHSLSLLFYAKCR